MSTSKVDSEISILGGGLSSIYAAYKLSNRKPTLGEVLNQRNMFPEMIPRDHNAELESELNRYRPRMIKNRSDDPVFQAIRCIQQQYNR